MQDLLCSLKFNRTMTAQNKNMKRNVSIANVMLSAYNYNNIVSQPVAVAVEKLMISKFRISCTIFPIRLSFLLLFLIKFFNNNFLSLPFRLNMLVESVIFLTKHFDVI